MHKGSLTTGACLALMMGGGVAHASAQSEKVQCARPAAGDFVQPPADIYSSGGVLNIALDYRTEVDAQGRRLFCFVTPDGLESPTLHVQPGDMLTISLTNKEPKTPQSPGMNGMRMPMVMDVRDKCGAGTVTAGSVNMHFHGLNVAPNCHQDEVIKTTVNPGQTFAYNIHIPPDEPPGLYWYHPHIHGLSSPAVLGGATGAIVVEGIQNLQPKVAKLPTRVLVMRDQPIIVANPPKKAPYWDISINYVPIIYPTYQPAQMVVQRGRKEFWRVVNASANTIDRLVLKFDGVAQQVEIAAEDGVVLGSQDGTHHGKLLLASEVYIPPASRAEFIIPPIPATVKHVTLETLKPDTGPAGDVETTRTMATILPGDEDQARMASLPVMPAVSGQPGPQRFDGLDKIKPDIVRHLILTEIFPDPQDPDEGLFYITVKGQVPQLFDPNAPPAITTTQGSVEDWIIENQTEEVHQFHIHQIHFQLREINGSPVPVSQRQIRDTYEVPYWTGTGPYTSIKVRMDFRGRVVGDFVYHCHILDHEDAGMMAIVRVNPRKG